MKTISFFCLILFAGALLAQGKAVFPEYPDEQKTVFDFFLDEPQKINSALYWIRSYMNPLLDEPYNMAPEFMDIIVLIHGTEIVVTAKHNYEKYKDAVERMKYYHSLGVKFRVCNLAASDYGYTAKDFYDFVEITPSAMIEISNLQQQGYGLITPQVLEKKLSIEEIR